MGCLAFSKKMTTIATGSDVPHGSKNPLVQPEEKSTEGEDSAPPEKRESTNLSAGLQHEMKADKAAKRLESKQSSSIVSFYHSGGMRKHPDRHMTFCQKMKNNTTSQNCVAFRFFDEK